MNSIFGAGMAYDMMVMKEAEKKDKAEQTSKGIDVSLPKNDFSKNKDDNKRC